MSITDTAEEIKMYAEVSRLPDRTTSGLPRSGCPLLVLGDNDFVRRREIVGGWG